MNPFAALGPCMRTLLGYWKTHRSVRGLLRLAAREIVLFFHLLRDRRVPVKPKIILLATLGFVLNPLNFMVTIPVWGQLEDIVITGLACRFFLKRVPADVLASHREALGLTDGFGMA